MNNIKRPKIKEGPTYKERLLEDIKEGKTPKDYLKYAGVHNKYVKIESHD